MNCMSLLISLNDTGDTLMVNLQGTFFHLFKSALILITIEMFILALFGRFRITTHFVSVQTI